MSWSFSGVGKPEALIRAIQGALCECDERSWYGFAEAALHLSALLSMAYQDAAVSVSANGHATWNGAERVSASIDVSIKQLGKLCE